MRCSIARARASRGDAAQVRSGAKALRARHTEAARALMPRGARLDELVGGIDAAFAELAQLAGGLGMLREITPRTIDYLVARGERLSAQLFAAALEASGCPAAYVDATEVVQTDGTFGNALRGPGPHRPERAPGARAGAGARRSPRRARLSRRRARRRGGEPWGAAGPT